MDAQAIAAEVAQRPLSVSMAMRLPVPREMHMEWDIHDGLEMVLHRRGQGMVSFSGGATQRFVAGSIEIYPPGLPHRLHPEQPGEEYFLRVAAIPAFTAMAGASLMLMADATLDHEFCTVTEPLAEGSALATAERNHRATALLLRMLDRLGQAQVNPRPAGVGPSTAERHAAEARRYLRAHATEVRFVEEVADALGLSHSHLRHVVREVYGHSLVRELMEARILLSERLLRETREPLAVIAKRCGFAHENYFCRVYRSLRGTAPGAARRMATVREPTARK